jgi:Protein of unknown function (DUF3800)
MRLIYVDEAGTSANEPVTIVVGLIVNPDTQWHPAIRLIQNALLLVPEEFRNNFLFHAAAIWGSKKYREIWKREDRKKFLCEMMSIPQKADIAIAYAAVRRDGPPVTGRGVLAELPKEKMQHTVAFGICMGMADYFIRERRAPNEIATVVAEDVHDMRELLRNSVATFRTSPFNIPEDVMPHLAGSVSQILTIDRRIRVERVIDTVHFAAKNEAYLLQLADACAFGLRIFFADESEGSDFIEPIGGWNVNTANDFVKDKYASLNMGILFKAPARQTVWTVTWKPGKGN